HIPRPGRHPLVTAGAPVTAPSPEDEKSSLRRLALARRASIDRDLRDAAPLAAARHFCDGVRLAADDVVAGYWPIRDEIDCRPLLEHLLAAGRAVALPGFTAAGGLSFRRWSDGEALHPAGFGTLAPPETAPVVQPTVMFVPLLGFDSEGTRLGYGKGHYDRAIASMPERPLLVGYGFAAQELDGIPREAHDVPLDIMITETGLRRFSGGGRGEERGATRATAVSG